MRTKNYRIIAVLLAWTAATLCAVVGNAQDDDSAAADAEAPTVIDTDPPPLEIDESESEEGEAASGSGFTKYDALLASLTIFVLAVFVGFEVITKVPPTLHTPLMSGSNAISGITIVGALLATGYAANGFVAVIGMIALALATINVVGGFLVTHRMLEMFKKKK